MLRRSIGAPTCSALVLLAGCFPQFGEYGGSGPESVVGAADASGGSGGAPLPLSCNGNGFCIEVPTGWEGPVALSEPGGRCGGAYAEQVSAGEADLSADPASCGCLCGQASGSTCPEAVVTRYFDVGCVSTDLVDTITVPAGTCTPIPVFGAASWGATATPAGGSCDGTDEQDTPPVLVTQRALCSAPAPSSCDGGLGCAPNPGEGLEPRICIVEDGDVDCPSPSFAVKRLLFTGGHEDTRACDLPCGCQPPSAICGGVVTGRQGPGCGSAQDGVAIGTCEDGYVDSNQSLTFSPVLMSEGTCDPVARAPIGEVVGVAPITLCCSGVL